MQSEDNCKKVTLELQGDLITRDTALENYTISPPNKTFILLKGCCVRHWNPTTSLMLFFPLNCRKPELLSYPSPCMEVMLWMCFWGRLFHCNPSSVKKSDRHLLQFHICINEGNRGSHCLLTMALVRVRKKQINLHFHALFSSKWQQCNCAWMRRQGYSVVWCFLFKICQKVNKLCTSIHAASTRKMLLSVIIAADIDGNRKGDGSVP